MTITAVVLFWTAWALIFYAYVVFPVLLSLFARRRAAASESGNEQDTTGLEELPRVAMIVAAYNEERVLADKLANTWKIDYPADRFTLVVGSDGSADGTAEILDGCADDRLRAFPFTERRGKISVLNDLVQRTNADILVFSDANTMFAPDAIRKMVRHFEDPQVGCVSGELGLEQDGGVSGEGLYWKYECWIKRNESRLGFLIGCNGGIFALPRGLYEPLPASVIVEDFVLTMRIVERGYQIRFEPEARATEPACPSSRAEMIRKIRIGAGNFQALGLTRRLLHPRFGLRAFAYWGHKVLRWCVPLFFVVALAANIVLVQQELYRLLLGLQVAGGLIAGLSYNARPGIKLPRWTRPISYFYLMNYALFCGFLRFLFGTQRVTWERAAR
jgi:cellulose synthase/poly-beta-1,6-N-acetylglucosamine synthase-like glycosyltransferase